MYLTHWKKMQMLIRTLNEGGGGGYKQNADANSYAEWGGGGGCEKGSDKYFHRNSNWDTFWKRTNIILTDQMAKKDWFSATTNKNRGTSESDWHKKKAKYLSYRNTALSRAHKRGKKRLTKIKKRNKTEEIWAKVPSDAKEWKSHLFHLRNVRGVWGVVIREAGQGIVERSWVGRPAVTTVPSGGGPALLAGPFNHQFLSDSRSVHLKPLGHDVPGADLFFGLCDRVLAEVGGAEWDGGGELVAAARVDGENHLKWKIDRKIQILRRQIIQSVNQSINQSANQSINQSIWL